MTNPHKYDLTDWPRGGYKNTAYLCTKARPMPEDAPGCWRHDDVHEIGDQVDGWPGGDIVTYECRSCRVRWRSELPQ